MNRTALAIGRAKYIKLITSIRRRYFKILGLNIMEGGILGEITCDWPNKVYIGKECTIQDRVDFRIEHPFMPENFIRIGDRVFIGRCCEFNCTSRITIGNDCMIASNTIIVDVGHQTGRDTTINMQPIISEEVNIEDDVWIGTGCIILKGITIGKGSVIGAGSIVTKSIPEYQIWAGSPARFIRNRI